MQYKRSIVEFICLQPAPRFTTGAWARSLSNDELEDLRSNFMRIIRESKTRPSAIAPCAELVSLVIGAERSPALALAGEHDIPVDEEEVRSAVPAFVLLVMAELGRRIGIVREYPESIFTISRGSVQANSSRELSGVKARSLAMLH